MFLAPCIFSEWLCCVDQAYYWRGMARMKLKQSKGIQDFNRALALDPALFQVLSQTATMLSMGMWG